MGSSSTEAFPAMQETLLEFRAGKMSFEGKRVVPDTHKGLVRIARGEEGLIHFQWLDRTQNVVEDDQIVFPDEAVFEKVNQASGRVYILKFNTDDRKLFIWMQEPKAEGDAQLCSFVNYFINQPLEFPNEEEPDASVPLQVSEDMVEDDVSSSPQLLKKIRALASYHDYKFTAYGNHIVVVKRAHQVATWSRHSAKVNLLLLFGKHILSVDIDGNMFIWVFKGIEENLALVGHIKLDDKFTPTSVIHPDTCLRKVNF